MTSNEKVFKSMLTYTEGEKFGNTIVKPIKKKD